MMPSKIQEERLEIPKTKALEYLAGYGSAVHCVQYRDYKWWYGDDTIAKFYYDRGCVIVDGESGNEGQHEFHCFIHHVAPDAEINAVTAEWKQLLTERAGKVENSRIVLVVYYVSNGELPPEREQYSGVRNYARMGKTVMFDSCVRELTQDDAELLYSTCKPYTENDAYFGRQEAEIFIETDYILNNEWKAFGIFDGERLAGAITRAYVQELDLVWLVDLYILPEYRGRGFGKALVRSALSEFPDKKWYYHTLRDNKASRALANALGFTLEGAELYLH